MSTDMGDSSRSKDLYQPNVYILLPVHNRCEITLRFIECLKKQTYSNYHLIIIDDGSADGTSQAAQESIEDITILRGNGNWWWAGSLQHGYNWLQSNKVPERSYVLVMNDDTEFSEDFLESGLKVIAKHPKTILTATGHNLKDRKPQDSGGYKFVWEDLTCLETYDCSEMNCLSTRGMLMKVEDFIGSRGFYPKLLPHYLSDLEFTMRAGENGLNLMTDSNFRIYINFDETGFRELGDEPLFSFMKKMFSTRSAGNPVYWSSFILLRAPWRLKLSNLLRVWFAAYRQIFIDRIYSVYMQPIKKFYYYFRQALSDFYSTNKQRLKRMLKKIIQIPF